MADEDYHPPPVPPLSHPIQQPAEYPPPPPMPPRPNNMSHTGAADFHTSTQYPSVPQINEPPPPPLPQRHGNYDTEAQIYQQPPPPSYSPADDAGQHSFQAAPPQFLPPPQRIKQTFSADDDPSNPIHYIRDPHKLIGYLVPFPKPKINSVTPESIPSRFMIYTPPPPPLQKPTEGTKEGKLHKVQRKWQEEVRSAKTSTAKTASWKGLKSKATKGIDWAMSKTTSSNLDFLGRVSPAHSDDERSDAEGAETHKTIGVEEMIMIYPPTMGLSETAMREEFVNTMLRTKSKAQRDTIIATGLMPVTYGIDILATFIWPFGGLGEIDTVWAYSSFRGAKTARSVTKRLSSTASTPSDGSHGKESEGQQQSGKDHLRLTFRDSGRIEVLKRYLESECHKVDSKLFPEYKTGPTESDVLEAIGWTPAGRGRQRAASPGADGEKEAPQIEMEDRNWEDERWEMEEVKDDLRNTFRKAAREWRKWCLLLEKNPEKAMKK
ncbi:hypothetical protein PV08_04534 [Exophiala spinifera]|uniref:Secreted protein n=1 Tax=Exophiala spinifera TaxID=91928 RepID=A0A0D1ZXD4_9EURO|nr:uncharacterized protein PV08_04534 [Exophiala spinifera]KIW17342.1 hypothetical protein PV08_04534 [Exophiala spinifera]